MAKKMIRTRRPDKATNKPETDSNTSGNGVVQVFYIEDSKNFHKYQAGLDQGCYVTMGVSKDADIPKTMTLELITKSDPRWAPAMEAFIESSTEGKKAWTRLMKSYQGRPGAA